MSFFRWFIVVTKGRDASERARMTDARPNGNIISFSQISGNDFLVLQNRLNRKQVLPHENLDPAAFVLPAWSIKHSTFSFVKWSSKFVSFFSFIKSHSTTFFTVEAPETGWEFFGMVGKERTKVVAVKSPTYVNHETINDLITENSVINNVKLAYMAC